MSDRRSSTNIGVALQCWVWPPRYQPWFHRCGWLRHWKVVTRRRVLERLAWGDKAKVHRDNSKKTLNTIHIKLDLEINRRNWKDRCIAAQERKGMPSQHPSIERKRKGQSGYNKNARQTSKSSSSRGRERVREEQAKRKKRRPSKEGKTINLWLSNGIKRGARLFHEWGRRLSG